MAMRCVLEGEKPARRGAPTNARLTLPVRKEAPMKRLQDVLDEYVVLKEQVRRARRKKKGKRREKGNADGKMRACGLDRTRRR